MLYDRERMIGGAVAKADPCYCHRVISSRYLQARAPFYPVGIFPASAFAAAPPPAARFHALLMLHGSVMDLCGTDKMLLQGYFLTVPYKICFQYGKVMCVWKIFYRWGS